MRHRTFAIDTGDGRLMVEIRGRGPSVLLLHGLSGNRRGWDRVAERVEDRYRLVLPDLLSRGESDPRPDLSHSLEREAGRLRELFWRLEPSPRLLVGHSQGATLALVLARDLPISGLVLASPVTPWTRRPRLLAALRPQWVRRAVGTIIRPFRRPLTTLILRRVFGPDTPVTRELVQKYAAPYGDPRRTEALMRIVSDWRPGDLAGRMPVEALPARTVVLIGDHDPRVLPKDAAALARRLDAPLWRAPGAGHVLPDEAPELIARAIRTVYEGMEVEPEP